jgi:beta-lactamase class A
VPDYYYHTRLIEIRKRRRRKKILLAGLIILIIFVALYSVFGGSQKNGKTTIKNPLEKVSPILSLAQKDLGIPNENFSVAIKNLKTNEVFYYNESKKFKAASLYKIWVMGTVFGLISQGKISEDEVLIGDKNELNINLEEATPSAAPSISNQPEKSEEEKKKELEERQVKYNVLNAIENMIVISDNYAAILVSSRSANVNVVSFLKKYGLEDSIYSKPPITTASDLAIVLEKIYKGEVIDKSYSQRMIDILKRQRLNDRIPKYLPENIPVAHKTGELELNKHDAGIVFLETGDYVIVVMSDTDDPTVASEKIAKFSKSVFDYFNKK